MALRLAKTSITRIDLGENDFLEVVEDISKGDFNALVAAMPQDVDEEKGLTPVQGTEFQAALFETLVKGWSLDVPPTPDNYLLLDRQSSDRIDAVLVEHFGSLTPDAPKDKSPKTSPSSSPKAKA